jgi:uracil-DNA glycosylase
VMGDGPDGASVMLVGEQPGDKEDLAGEPFVGPAGKLLDRALEAAGIAPRSVFRTNAVKHFRFSGTRGKQRIHATPDQLHVEACEPWLQAELRVVAPHGLVLLGATAGKAVFGPTFKVTQVRGQLQLWPEPFALETPPQWVLPTIHPSAVLRAPDRDTAFDALVADLRVAAAQLN